MIPNGIHSLTLKILNQNFMILGFQNHDNTQILEVQTFLRNFRY